MEGKKIYKKLINLQSSLSIPSGLMLCETNLKVENISKMNFPIIILAQRCLQGSQGSGLSCCCCVWCLSGCLCSATISQLSAAWICLHEPCGPPCHTAKFIMCISCVQSVHKANLFTSPKTQ